MQKRATTKKRQPPKPRKGASPTEIKAWIAACGEQDTPEERAEYEATGEDLRAIFKRIGFDPISGEFATKERVFEIEIDLNDE